MATRTNIAERLSHVFARLDKEIPDQQNNALPLLHAWRTVLRPPNNDDLKLVANIGHISSAMLKLESQVSASQNLQPAYKQAAMNTIVQLRSMLTFSNFTQPAVKFKSLCSVNAHGTLGFLGMALASEFSEPRLQPADAEEIKNALLEVKELLEDTSIALDLRHDLITQIEQMLWWLQDPDVVSSSELYEKVGSATFTAKLIVDADKMPSSDSAAQRVFNKVSGMAAKMISIMSTATKVIDGVSKLDSSVHHLLTLPPP